VQLAGRVDRPLRVTSEPRQGLWLLSAGVGWGGRYDTNVNSTAINPQKVWGTNFQPTLLAERNTGIQRTQLYLNGDITYYPSIGRVDLQGTRAGLIHVWEIQRDLIFRIQGQVAEVQSGSSFNNFLTSGIYATTPVNYTQIFSATVEVSGTELAVRQIGVRDELDYQKNQRLRELMRDLENCVINGVMPAATPQGSATVRRTMRGINAFIATNRFSPGSGIPSGSTLSEAQLNAALREVWKNSSGQIDLIVVGGPEKRAINSFITSSRRYTGDTETFKELVSVYESDFGVCRVVLSRWVPAGTVLLLDSSRIEVMPLSGRSFHYKPLAVTGDRDAGQLIGEYTLEMRNESAHGVISGFGE
jgi:hypothetical protein